MRTIRTKVYQFEELDNKAKRNAIDSLATINTDFDWYEAIYEDAENIGLKLDSFDLDSASYIRDLRGEFITSAGEVVEKILSDHGKDCETYKTALKYKHQFDKVHLHRFHHLLIGIEDALLNELLMDYTKMLQDELEYLQTDEAIIETIQANSYEFTKDGKRFHS